jgi:hypothetical protein
MVAHFLQQTFTGFHPYFLRTEINSHQPWQKKRISWCLKQPNPLLSAFD